MTYILYRCDYNWWECCCCSWRCCWWYSDRVVYHPGGNSSVGGSQKEEKRCVYKSQVRKVIIVFSESVRLKSNDSIEMDNKFDVSVTCVVSVYCYNPCLLLKGEYSELRHDGPKKNSKKVSFCDSYSFFTSLLLIVVPASSSR